MATAEEIADRAQNLKTGFAGLSLALPTLLDPGLPVLDYYRRYGTPADAPFQIKRVDGTMHSDESIGTVLKRVTETPGGGLGEDLLPLTALHGALRIGDDLQASGLIEKTSPLLQFARHFRNACAHGNRWHFVNGEPRYPAELRGRSLGPAMHGTQAVFDWVGPGDYLDFLDDISAELRSRN